ncbi:MAG: hypothetical protein KA792_08175, partial [Bacteroidales bacterium]|nr:hypothetical protein [Bacteroidales bacterium]
MMRIFRIVVFISVSFLLINNSCFPQFKYLFTDDRWIANTYAVSRELHQPEKISNNPLMIADKEWEQGINCFGTVLF